MYIHTVIQAVYPYTVVREARSGNGFPRPSLASDWPLTVVDSYHQLLLERDRPFSASATFESEH